MAVHTSLPAIEAAEILPLNISCRFALGEVIVMGDISKRHIAVMGSAFSSKGIAEAISLSKTTVNRALRVAKEFGYIEIEIVLNHSIITV